MVVTILAAVITYQVWQNGRWVRLAHQETQDWMKQAHQETRKEITEARKEAAETLKEIARLIVAEGKKPDKLKRPELIQVECEAGRV